MVVTTREIMIMRNWQNKNRDRLYRLIEIGAKRPPTRRLLVRVMPLLGARLTDYSGERAEAFSAVWFLAAYGWMSNSPEVEEAELEGEDSSPSNSASSTSG